jgi:hypothetical protein
MTALRIHGDQHVHPITGQRIHHPWLALVPDAESLAALEALELALSPGRPEAWRYS